MLKCIENGKQTILDVGQKGIGMEHCVKCGMVYSLETPSDVKQHERFHNRFTETANFRVSQTQIEHWKSSLQYENVESPLPGILFGLRLSSTATLKRKLETIITNFVNEEIGYAADLPVWDARGKRKAFVFVSNSKPPFIGGVLLVDPVIEVILMPEGKHFKAPKIGSFLGVDRIWVHSHLRRKGLATFLLDSARRLLSPKDGTLLTKTRVAFGDPNDLCVKLAINYVQGNKDKNSPSATSKQHNHYITYSHTCPINDRVDLLAAKLTA